jgi:ATP-binding cassette subfamily B protein
MDCGPAALKAALQGFGISASYARLREACQTDVDGTSIDTLEEVANLLGLNAEQMLVPTDHLLIDEPTSLPALIAMQLPNGFGHFCIAWGMTGPFVQVMDPAIGRRWMRRKQFLAELFPLPHPFPAEDWREWAGSDGFCAPLRTRLTRLVNGDTTTLATVEQLLADALADPDWYPIACLDAATRMSESLVQAGGVQRGKQAFALLETLVASSPYVPDEVNPTIPAPYWTVQPYANEEGMLLMTGALLIQFHGVRSDPYVEAAAAQEEQEEPVAAAQEEQEKPAAAAQEEQEKPAAAAQEEQEEPTDPSSPSSPSTKLSRELAATLDTQPEQPGREILQMLRADGLTSVVMVLLALGAIGVGLTIEQFMLRGLTDVFWARVSFDLRLTIAGALIFFLIGIFLLDFFNDSTLLSIGRNLEARFHLRFLEKIPRLNDRYFQSRLISDMIQRVHTLRQIRMLPILFSSVVALTAQLLLTTVGLVWLHLSGAPFAILMTSSIAAVVLLSQPLFFERDLCIRSHLGALSRFYLDALLGIIPIRTHSAEDAMRREHEGLLVKWFRANHDFLTTYLVSLAIQLVASMSFAVVMLFLYMQQGGSRAGILLYFFWVLVLPRIGRQLLITILQYPMQRNLVLRLLEPITTPEEKEDSPQPSPASPETPATKTAPMASAHGIALSFAQVTVRAGGHVILADINLQIQPGEHVAIVGPSGAGKSSLVGLLLGWHRPAEGHICVDDDVLHHDRLKQLRRETVWVDPSVQIWNRSLLENLRYGNIPDQSGNEQDHRLKLEQADLHTLLKRLPDGLQTVLGEGGGLVSGGEGQRVRLGRAMQREGVRLVILDEPFRGLDRAKRRTLLAQAREQWADATLLFISHDIDESQHFARVLVIEEGQVVEDGQPNALVAQPHTRYHALHRADAAVREGMWSDEVWQRLWLSDGVLRRGEEDRE